MKTPARPLHLVLSLALAAVFLIGAAFLLFMGVSYYQHVSRTRELIANPLPTPEFINTLQPYPGQVGPFAGLVCFTIVDEPLWEPGNQADMLDKHLLSHLQLTVDNEVIRSTPSSQSVLQMLGAKYDIQGESIGTFGGSIRTCFKLDLGQGPHTANVRVVTLSGVPYTYEWAFDIQTTDV
jgi:hypothetical protein